MNYIEEQIEYFQKKRDWIREKLAQINVDTSDFQKMEHKRYTLNISSLKELKVACVMDRFTLESYSPECQLFEVTPENWKEEIESFQPHLLFIESAWKGKDDSWYRKIANGSKEYFEMTSYCQEHDIPIVFWNKEDPVYTDTFMPAARMADFVFTTDIDCIKKYKNELKHDNVFFLHFAAQPTIHNPIEKYERKDKYCFAGAYYHKYKQRSETFDKFAEVFINSKGFDIYDRNYKNSLPEHAFPKNYDPYILGSLDPKEIDIAYKGYNYGINMNSVDQSQTMFARRVYEMLASNTVTIGNYSRGVKNLFGDLTICTNDSQTMAKALDTWCCDDNIFGKYRLAGLRKVLSQHLYADRLDYIVSKAFGVSLKEKLPQIYVVAEVSNNHEAENILSYFEKQSYENKMLYMFTDDESVKDSIATDAANIVVASKESLESMGWKLFAENSYVSIMSSQHYYGANYLLDLALTLRYGQYIAIGKKCFYSYEDDYILENQNMRYKAVDTLDTDRTIISVEYCKSAFTSLKELLKTTVVQSEDLFSVDEYNFCQNYVENHCVKVDDLVIADQGIPLCRIEHIAETIKRDLLANDAGTVLPMEQLAQELGKAKSQAITVEWKNNKIQLSGEVKKDSNEYLYFGQFYRVDDYRSDDKLTIFFEGNGSLDFLGVCVFYDANKAKISPAFPKPNRLFSCDIPENAVFFKLGIRLTGVGEFSLKNITIGATKIANENACFLSRSNVLVLSNQYPSYENLYRNMFVHQRISAYKAEGAVFDAMRMNIYAKEGYHEFEGINIVEGQSDTLANILSNGDIDTVCVHFLDAQMWEVLKRYGKKLRILVWVHGAEIQPWWRRAYNYTTESELEKAKKESDIRLAFWANVFEEQKNMNVHFIFVSQYFADEIFEDNNVQLPKENYSIIHNCIDAELFDYIPKDAEQRKKLLSIRPYASNKYANDLTVKCILELSKREYFSELEFLLVGNGELFDEILKPLKKFKNVILKKTFLRQGEIAELHKQYGIFITPTRMDAQGVSRDEAMSSGLVPVTNSVTAIPEFVDDTCGILAPGEDYLAMAAGIEKLYKDPEYFCELSKNAAMRVRRQTTKEYTIDKELKLIING